MNPRRPTHLLLGVTDLARSLGFWHDALGLPVKLRGPGWAELQTDTILVVLVEREPAGAGATLGFEVDDLEAERERLAARGIALEPDDSLPREAFGRRLVARDPDGHLLELRSYD